MNKLKRRRQIIISIVILIGFLLLGNIFLIYQNTLELEKNRKLKIEAEQIKVATLEVIRTIHLLDLGIRGVALVNSEQIGSAIDTARVWRVRNFNYLEKTLSTQNFPMKNFYQFRDTVKSYYELAGYMESLIDNKLFEKMIGAYDGPQGEQRFREVLCDYLNDNFNWNLTTQNIALTNGSQNSFFYLFNALAGDMPDGRHRKILFPLS